jgi:simple sugar transport system ATP-binding protein
MDVHRGAHGALTKVSDVALELASITRVFGRVAALTSANLSVRRGTLHALLGENGAGKTTLMRIAFGMIQPDAGRIVVDGVDRRFASPGDAIDAGIGMVHQHFTLVPAMTVAENIALGGHGSLNPARLRKCTSEIAERTGLRIDPDARVEDLPAGAQQRVEILKALSRDARILILDEPTAVLTPTEARELLVRARELASSGGTAILITHKLRDALEFADDVTVLRRGTTVWSGAAAGATEDILVSAMLGGEHFRPERQGSVVAPATSREPLMSLKHVSADDALGVKRLDSVTISIHGGEIVGIAAVEGNGQRELLRVLAGRMETTDGLVSIPEIVGFIPEDRKRDALVEDFPLRDNVALLGAGARSGFMRWGDVAAETSKLMDEYDVRARDDSVRAGALSGGNQQKLVVGREIEGSQTALVAENPTRGLDVQATAAVHARIRAARDAGMAVVFYSSDLDEVVALADRVVVMFDGRAGEVTKKHDMIGRAMLGLPAI